MVLAALALINQIHHSGQYREVYKIQPLKMACLINKETFSCCKGVCNNIIEELHSAMLLWFPQLEYKMSYILQEYYNTLLPIARELYSDWFGMM